LGADRSTGVHSACAAVDELGSSEEIAAAFRSELTFKQGRRHAAGFILCGASIVTLWAHAAQMSDKPTQPMWPLLCAPPCRIAVAALALAIATGIITLLTTGRLTRWIADRPRAISMTAAIGGLGSAIADVVILALLAVRFILPRHPLAPIPITVATIATLAGLTFARRAASGYLSYMRALAR
jgi:hypothetical protein